MSTLSIVNDLPMNDQSSALKARPLSVAASRWVKALASHCVSIVLSLAAWVAIFCTLITGVSTVIIWVGIPVIAASFGLAHLYARAKKSMAQWLGATTWDELPQASYDPGLWNWIKAELGKPKRWREMAYGLIGSVADWILALIPLTVFFGGIAQTVAAIAVPVVDPSIVTSLPSAGTTAGDEQVTVPFTLAHRLFSIGIGLAATVIGIILVAACAYAQTAVTRFFLAPGRRATQKRIAEVEQAKALGEQAEAQSLTRIERDLHDGPQQSLIRSSLDLATLDRRLAEGDVASAQELVADIRSRNDATLADIRALSRGFAPPVLVEKGLREAIVSLAATSPLPVSVSTELVGPRLPEPVERAVYFAVSEGLANVTKHSDATSATVHVVRGSAAVQAEIADNGKGGATALPGHGLDGLANRLASVSGSLVIDSLPGEGTRLLIEVPLS